MKKSVQFLEISSQKETDKFKLGKTGRDYRRKRRDGKKDINFNLMLEATAHSLPFSCPRVTNQGIPLPLKSLRIIGSDAGVHSRCSAHTLVHLYVIIGLNALHTHA